MAFRWQDNTQLMLMRQMVDHEYTAKKNFDYYTGKNTAQLFYQGRLNKTATDKTPTWVKDQSALQQKSFGYKNTEDVGKEKAASRASHQSAKVSRKGQLDSERSHALSSFTPSEKFNRTLVHGRFNKVVDPRTKFHPDSYSQVYNADRMGGMTAYDVMRDPHITIKPPQKPKDCGYFELNKRGTEAHDRKSKVIHDYNGNVIIKIDSLHGQKNGNLWGQTTHVNLHGSDRPNMRTTFGRDSHYIPETGSKRYARAASQAEPSRKTSSSVQGSVAKLGIEEITEKQAMARKLHLMRKMLKNEKRANELISEKLNKVITHGHGSSLTAEIVEKVMSEDARLRN